MHIACVQSNYAVAGLNAKTTAEYLLSCYSLPIFCISQLKLKLCSESG